MVRLVTIADDLTAHEKAKANDVSEINCWNFEVLLKLQWFAIRNST